MEKCITTDKRDLFGAFLLSQKIRDRIKRRALYRYLTMYAYNDHIQTLDPVCHYVHDVHIKAFERSRAVSL